MDTDPPETLAPDTDPPETLAPVDHDTNRDELLDAAAQGMNATSDDTSDGEDGEEGTGEIDAIGEAAGFVVRDDKPFRGIEEVERRDQHRWELDPASAEPDPAASAGPDPASAEPDPAASAGPDRSDEQESIDPASAEA
jgi:hypothetical protein